MALPCRSGPRLTGKFEHMTTIKIRSLRRGRAAGATDRDSRGSISWNEDYVGVFQFNANTQTTHESIHNYWNKTFHTSRTFDFNRNLPQANKKICVGWSESANTDDKMYGFVRQIAIYDSILDDAIVSDLRRLFFEQVPVGGYADLIPNSVTAQLSRDYLLYNHIVVSSTLTIQGSVHSITSHLTTIHQKAPKRLFEINNGATLTLKQVKLKGGSGTVERKELLKQALGYWDFTVSMRDIAGTVGNMLFVRGTATIGDGGADGKGLRIDTPNDLVRTRLLAPVSLPFTKTLVACVTLHDLSKTAGAVISVINTAANFDALVFAEINPGKWIAGSDFDRTKDVAFSAESTTEEKFCLAATYDNRLKNDRGAIQLYRNGIKYGLPYRKNVANNYLQKRIYNAGDWGIQIGKYTIEPASKFTQLLQRANPMSPFRTTLLCGITGYRNHTHGSINATVHEVSLWNRALTDYEIAILHRTYTSPGGVKVNQGSLQIKNSVLTQYGWKGMEDGRHIFDRSNGQSVEIDSSILSYGFGATKWGNSYDGGRGCAGLFIDSYSSSTQAWETEELHTVNDHYCF